MPGENQIHGQDIEMDKLIPLNTREINFSKNRSYQRLLSTIKMIGLIEPLDVYRENGHYVILNGFLRFKVLQELKVQTAPCLIHANKESYTFNKMINRLSPVQESRMMQQALKTLDRTTMAEVFGIKSIQYHMGTVLLNQLTPKIVDAMDKGLITRRVANELTYVTKNRQEQIVREMSRTSDYSASFARALIIKTPSEMRNPEKKIKKPWVKDPEKKQELVAKLEVVTKRYDFYTDLYRQYSADLLKLYVYVRKLITNEKVRLYLEINFAEIYAQFENIVFETNGISAPKK